MYKTRRTQLLTSFIPSCKIMQRLWSSRTEFCFWVCAYRGSIVRAKRQIASNDGPHQWQHKNLSFEQKREPSCGRYGTRHILECRRHIDYIVREDHTCMNIYVQYIYVWNLYAHHPNVRNTGNAENRTSSHLLNFRHLRLLLLSLCSKSAILRIFAYITIL